MLQNTLQLAVSPSDNGVLSRLDFSKCGASPCFLVSGEMARAATPGAGLTASFEHLAHLLRFKTWRVVSVSVRSMKP